MRAAWLLPVGGAVAGLLVNGPWALAGVAAGLVAALAVLRMGAGEVPAALAAALPPIFARDTSGVAVLVALGIVAASQLGARWWMLLPAGAAAVLPDPLGGVAPALAGAALFALAPWPFALLGVPVALAGLVWLVPAKAIPGALALVAAVAARWVTTHPANLTMATRLGQLGLLALPLPAALGLLLAAIGRGPEHVWGVFGLALAAAALGAVLFAAHVGLGLLLRTAERTTVAWLTLTWCVGGAGVGVVLAFGVHSAEWAMGLTGLVAVPAAIGVAGLVTFRQHARNERRARVSENVHN